MQNIFKYHLLQYTVPRKILEKVSITKKFTQCKTSRTLKTDVFEIPDNKRNGKLLLKYECFSWIRLIPVLIHLKYWYYGSTNLELPSLPSPFLSNFTLAN